MGYILPILAYLIGSLLFAKLIASIKGVDISKIGSKNPGATNIARALGFRWGLVVFLLDASKGLLPTLLAKHFYGPESLTYALTAIASVLGHNFPIYYGFRGGKGVATSFGIAVVFSPLGSMLSALIWGLVFWKTRISAIASILAIISFVIACAILKIPTYPMIATIFISALIIIRHYPNIKRLIRGEEHSFR